jgi:lipopolysaccharide/colanic/teichoic acid biosynthesis glycosyltransferase
MTPRDALIKRVFDLVLSIALLAVSWWLIVAAVIAATIDTRRFGLFTQQRVGRDGRPFTLYKVRTMRDIAGVATMVTTAEDPRITPLGRLLRRTKIDELPQLINVVKGDMSFVGPRPDVPGFADLLEGNDRIVLSIRPGVTGPATLKYRDEEALLTEVDDPETYNREVIFPDKVAINRHYIETYSLGRDVRYIIDTVRPRRACHRRRDPRPVDTAPAMAALRRRAGPGRRRCPRIRPRQLLDGR